MLQLTDQRPRVYVKAESGEEIDIGYACRFDYAEGSIELPDNLPGGSEVYVNGQYLTTTAVEIRMKPVAPHALRVKVLAAAIGAILYGRPA